MSYDAPPILPWLCVFTLGGLTFAACAEVTESRTYQMVVREAPPSIAPAAGVKICQADTDNCEPTDPFGRAELRVPIDQEIEFTFEKQGYGRFIAPDVSDETYGSYGRGDGVENGWRIYSDEQLAVIAQDLGISYPWEGGMVGLSVAADRGFEGVTFTPFGPTISAVGEQFYYDVANEQYRFDLEATTQVDRSPELPFRDSGFTSVDPGEHQFEFGGTARNCPRLSWGWPVDGEPNRIRIPVRAGYITYGSMVCE